MNAVASVLGTHCHFHFVSPVVSSVVRIFDCRHDLLRDMPHHRRCSLKVLDIEVFLQVTTDLCSSVDFSVNHLGVLLFESGILGHLLLIDRNHSRECVHDILLLSIGFAKVLRLVLFVLVYVADLWFALPAVDCALSVLLIMSPDRRCTSRCPRALVACISLLTTRSLAVVPSLFLSRVTASRFVSCTSNFTTQLAPLRDHGFAVDARAPRHCSLQQPVLLSPSGLGDSSTASRCTSDLQHRCADVYTLMTMVFAENKHGVLIK